MWRQPGLVAVASKLAASAGPHKPINVVVPDTYEPARDSEEAPHDSGGSLWRATAGFEADLDT